MQYNFGECYYRLRQFDRAIEECKLGLQQQIENAGRYYAEVTNPAAPDLALFSQHINIQVCDEQMDSLELVELYNATSGPAWNPSVNWLTPGLPIGDWDGVTPDEFGCVKKIRT